MSERKRFLLRISPELWEEIQSMAAQEFRSVNGQIEYLLEEAVRDRRRTRRERGGAGGAQAAGGSSGG